MLFLWLIGFSFLCGSAANAIAPPDGDDGKFMRFDDIVFSKKQWNTILQRREARKNKANFLLNAADSQDFDGDIIIWPNKTVNYFFPDEETWPGNSKQKIRKLIEDFKEVLHFSTCVRLEERKAEFSAKVLNGRNGQERCSAAVGVDEGMQPQPLTLHHKCADQPGTVHHELLHLLGLEHSHSRYDRDEYLEMHMENLYEGVDRRQFDKDLKGGFKMTRNPFDFASLMQYQAINSAKADGLLTMSPKHEKEYTYTMGATEIAFSDLLTVNKLYSCFDSSVNAGLKCQNGGFPSPTVKGKCVCPAAFDDTNDCGDPPAVVGKKVIQEIAYLRVMSATKTWYNYTISTLFPRDRLRIKKSNPSDVVGIRLKHLTVRPKGKTNAFCFHGCEFGYLEIKNNRQHAGIRICCVNTTYRMFTSTLETTVVKVKSLHKNVNVHADFEFGLIS